MLIGYTLILVVDKVIFDTHSVLGDHEHDNQGDNTTHDKLLRARSGNRTGSVAEASEVLKKSIAQLANNK